MGMEWLAPVVASLVGAVLAFIGTSTGVQRLYSAGRIRLSIRDELAILKDFPESATRTELQQHVERQVRLLIAEEEPPTEKERQNRRWGWVLVLLGVLLLPVGVMESSNGPIWLQAVWALLASAVGFTGAWWIIGVRNDLSRRRSVLRQAVDQR